MHELCIILQTSFLRWDHVVSWEPEGHYYSSKMFRWEPEGCYHCIKSMVIVPFWFSQEHLWSAIMSFWLSADDMPDWHSWFLSSLGRGWPMVEVHPNSWHKNHICALQWIFVIPSSQGEECKHHYIFNCVIYASFTARQLDESISVSEMPLFRKFQIERKNFRKMNCVSRFKKEIIIKGGKGLEKKKMYQKSLNKNQTGKLFHTIVFIQVF